MSQDEIHSGRHQYMLLQSQLGEEKQIYGRQSVLRSHTNLECGSGRRSCTLTVVQRFENSIKPQGSKHEEAITALNNMTSGPGE